MDQVVADAEAERETLRKKPPPSAPHTPSPSRAQLRASWAHNGVLQPTPPGPASPHALARPRLASPSLLEPAALSSSRSPAQEPPKFRPQPPT